MEVDDPPVTVTNARGGMYGFLKFIERNRFYLQLLLVVILIQAFYIAWYRRTKGESAKAVQTSSQSRETVDAPMPEAHSGEADEGIFSGSLSAIYLGELVQFLHSASETGKLTITDPSDPGARELYFHSGQITDARHGHKDGEAAVSLLLTQKKGTFAFVRQDTPARNSAITKGTMAMLLEAHKSMDEEGAAA